MLRSLSHECPLHFSQLWVKEAGCPLTPVEMLRGTQDLGSAKFLHQRQTDPSSQPIVGADQPLPVA